VSAPLLSALAEALDAEVARWEARARATRKPAPCCVHSSACASCSGSSGCADGESAAAPAGSAPGGADPGHGSPAPHPVRRRPRIQRVPVQG
jgi:hypothetical protein